MTDEIFAAGCFVVFCAQLAGPTGLYADRLESARTAYVQEVEAGQLTVHLPEMYDAD